MIAGGSFLVELGWPAKQLSPNARIHWAEKHRFTKASRDTAYWATKAAMGVKKYPHDGGRITFVVTAYPPDRRARDDDNLIAQIKPSRDGIALALGIDDKFFDQRLQWAEPIRHGKIVVEVRQ